MEGEAVPPEARQSQLYKIIFICYTGFAGILEYMQNNIFIRPPKVEEPSLIYNYVGSCKRMGS